MRSTRKNERRERLGMRSGQLIGGFGEEHLDFVRTPSRTTCSQNACKAPIISALLQGASRFMARANLRRTSINREGLLEHDRSLERLQYLWQGMKGTQVHGVGPKKPARRKGARPTRTRPNRQSVASGPALQFLSPPSPELTPCVQLFVSYSPTWTNLGERLRRSKQSFSL